MFSYKYIKTNEELELFSKKNKLYTLYKLYIWVYCSVELIHNYNNTAIK
jgi:hypothetical protein